MVKRFFALVGMLGVVIVAAWLGRAATTGHAQTNGPANGSPPAWKAARTPWGHPDFQGIWNSKTQTPLERPEKFAGREFLTDEEAAALERETVENPGRDRRAERGSVADVEGAYNNAFSSFFGTRVVRTRRTSLIVDPPDGKVPARTPEGEKRRAAGRRINTSEFGPAGRADGPEERVNDRCPGVSLPCVNALCAFTRIVQSPDAVAIYYESGHWGGAYRHIPLSGHPHAPSTIRQWLGDSRGRWEGDTLVVDTTNFTDKTRFEGAGGNLHLIERFTRTSQDLLLYRATIDDPTTFVKPWTLELTWGQVDNKANTVFESACHEGNYALTGILAGARALEKEHAAQKHSRTR